MRDAWRFLRANPQVLVLLVICLLLGVATFLAVIFGLVTSHHDSITGEPSGSVGLLRAAALAPR